MVEREKRGWICLDIDGTITDNPHSIPQKVLQYLKTLDQSGWQIAFVTGRTFSFAHFLLKDFDADYFLIPQNGASAFEMPCKKMLFKNYIPIETFLGLEKVLESKDGHDFVFFGGYDQDEKIFYRPEKVSYEIRNYFEKTLFSISGPWNKIKNFNELPFSEVPYGKIYGRPELLKEIENDLKGENSIKVHRVVDSVNPEFNILQIMNREVDKGRAVLSVMNQLALPRPIISAGNDNNDEALLQIADISIAMSGSPAVLTDQATMIAPPVEELGIIPALELATQKLEKSL